MNPRSLVARALMSLTVLVATAHAQSQLVIKSNLVPGCTDNVTAVADYDGSGKADLLEVALTTPALGPALKVVRDPAAPGGGTCQTTPIPILTNPAITAMSANLNGDAHPDAIVRAIGELRIVDAYGNGAGGFTFPGTGPYFTASTSPVSPVVVHDFDLDGRDDAVVLKENLPYGTVEVFLNTAAGWVGAWSYVLPAQARSFGSGDVDGDAIVDLVWIENWSAAMPPESRLRIARGMGGGAFSVTGTVPVSPIPPAAPWIPGAVISAVGDLDGDGMADVITSDTGFTGSQPMSLIFGVAGPALPTVTNLPSIFGSIVFAAVVDFDRDGIVDIVQEATYSGAPLNRFLAVTRGLGARQFTWPMAVGEDVLANPFTAVAWFPADMDGDQDVDVVRSLGPLGSPVATLQLYDNQTIYAPGCSGSPGTNPTITVGTAHGSNLGFAIGVHSAPPGAPAVLGLSTARVSVGGCGVALNLGLAHMILPTPSLGVTVTDASGAAAIALPLPAGFLTGVVVYAQWGVVDPAGALPFAGQSFALTEARTIVSW